MDRSVVEMVQLGQSAPNCSIWSNMVNHWFIMNYAQNEVLDSVSGGLLGHVLTTYWTGPCTWWYPLTWMLEDCTHELVISGNIQSGSDRNGDTKNGVLDYRYQEHDLKSNTSIWSWT